MLTSNLATRPFYNTQLVRSVFVAAAVVLVLVSGLHLLWARSLQHKERQLSARATEARQQADRLREDARRMRAQINQKELEALSASAREVNSVIEQRAFSWGSLLVQLERTLPAEVRVKGIQPALDEEDIVVSLRVVGRNDEDLSAFMNALEHEGAFREVVPDERQWDDMGINAVIRGIFVPATPRTVLNPTKHTSTGVRDKAGR